MGRKKSTEKTTSGRPRKKKEEVVNEQIAEQTATEQQQEETVAADVDELPQITEKHTADEQAVKESVETENVQSEEQVQEPQPEPAFSEELQEEADEEELKRQRHREFMAEMNKVPEADTREMMNFLGITVLPQFTSADADRWCRAIARVRKRDTSVSWVILERRGVTQFGITKIFGRCSPIAQVGQPIPVEVIPARFSAKVNKYSVDSVRNFVAEHIGEEKAKEMTAEELNDELVRIEIKLYENFKKYENE